MTKALFFEADGFFETYLIPEVEGKNTLDLANLTKALAQYNLAHSLALGPLDIQQTLKERVIEHYQPDRPNQLRSFNPETLVRIYVLLADLNFFQGLV